LSAGRVKNFLFSTSRSPLGPTQPPMQWVPWARSLAVKRPGRESDYSSPTSAEVKKMWIYTSTPPHAFMTQYLATHRHNCTFTLPYPLDAGRPRGRSSSPGRVKNVLFSKSSRPAVRSTKPPIQWVPGLLSPEVKRPGREVNHSPPTSAEVKKMWTYTSTPPYAFMA
jgi:hypothetical protein